MVALYILASTLIYSIVAFTALHFMLNNTSNLTQIIKGRLPEKIKHPKLQNSTVSTHNSLCHNISEMESYRKTHSSNVTYPSCTSIEMGPMIVSTKYINLHTLYEKELAYIKQGGWWSPDNCTVNEMTAIIIPFRDRYQHLPILLRQLFPLLKRQQIHHRVFVVEQDDKYPFNRGKLRNIGFVEALKIFPYSCFVFHDVDLIPEDDRISYGCKKSPMHLSVAIDKFDYKLPYRQIFGGVQMLRTADYRKINGFSNLFYRWGGEDDNFYRRTIAVVNRLHRQSAVIARYTMLRHKQDNWTAEGGADTKIKMKTAMKYRKEEGLTSLQYKTNEIIEKNLFTLIKVNVQKDKDKSFV